MQDLRIFERVATRLNFAEAARELGLSPTAVTRGVAGLETRLRVRLLTRTTRRCRLTHDGEVFLERCRAILASVEEAEEEMRMRHHGPAGLLRVAAPLSFGRRHVAPLVRDYRAAHPEVTVNLCLSDRSDDLNLREFDLAIRVGRPDRGSYVIRRVLRTRRAVVVAPAYLAGRAAPMVPADLTGHSCLALLRDDRPLDRWMFRVDGHMQSVRVPVSLASNSGEVVHEWALLGAGIALKTLWDVEEDLRQGRLVELFREDLREAADLFLVYPERRNLPARVRSFIDFLTSRMDLLGDRLADGLE